MPSLALLAVVLLGAAACASAPADPPGADWMLAQIRALSAPEAEGRASGTPGADRAARHVAAAFRAAGLRPAGDAGTYFQAFAVPTGVALGPVNTLAVTAPAPRALALGVDFTPLPVSADGVVEGDLAFAGHGITAPDLGYDDYAGLDVRGKVVLVLTHEPRARDPSGPFRRPDAYHYSEHSHKVINAREHGARAVLLVTHPAAERERLPEPGGLSQPWGVIAAFVTRSVADALLASSGQTVAGLAAAIDAPLAPRSFPVPGVRVRLEVDLVRQQGTAANVVGVLPGTDPALRDEAIVLGAHYDHLGHGGEGSLAPDLVGTIHHGADDNASGTAVLMALARAFAASGGAPRTLVFAAFAGEEMGLLGSVHYVKHPPHPMERTALMVNFDMIGRVREGRLYVAGVDSGTGLRARVAEAAAGLGLSLQLQGDPYTPSDHTSFYAAGRPVLFFFSGAHEDYHRPSDTWEKINAAGLEAVAAAGRRLVAAVAAQPEAPAYVKLEAPASSGRSSGSGYGPFLGVVPEFGDQERDGVRVSGVRAGSPAERAGVQGGDLIVSFAGVDVKTLQDFVFVLRGRRAGDVVDIVLRRDGQEVRTRATLEERRR